MHASVLYADAHGIGGSLSNTNSHAIADSHPNANTYSDANAHSHAYANTDADANPRADPDSYSNSYAYPYGNTNSDPDELATLPEQVVDENASSQSVELHGCVALPLMQFYKAPEQRGKSLWERLFHKFC